MANVVIVSKHLFMNDNGVDYALGTNASDIITFSNLKKAEEYVAEQIDIYNKDEDEPSFDYYEYKKEYCFYQGVKAMQVYSQLGYNKNGIRKAFRITKQEIM